MGTGNKPSLFKSEFFNHSFKRSLLKHPNEYPKEQGTPLKDFRDKVKREAWGPGTMKVGTGVARPEEAEWEAETW